MRAEQRRRRSEQGRLWRSVDDNIRKFYAGQGKTYTLVQQLKALGSASGLWLDKVKRWQEVEKWAMMAKAAELTEVQKTNPLVKLLVQEPASAPEPTTKKAKAARRGGKRKKVVVRESEEEEAREEEAEEEQQLYVAELDMYVPVDLVELALGDPAGNEQPIDSPIEDQGMDDYLAMAVVPMGVGEQDAPAEEEETEQEIETQLLVYKRRNRRRGIEEAPAAPGGDEYEPAIEVEEAAEVEEQGGIQDLDEEAELAIIPVGEEQPGIGIDQGEEAAGPEEQGAEEETEVELIERSAEAGTEMEQPAVGVEEGQ